MMPISERSAKWSLRYTQKCSKICLSEKLRAKFPANTSGCSIVKIAHLNDILKVFQLQASQVEGQSLQKKEKTRRKSLKPKDVGHFLSNF